MKTFVGKVLKKSWPKTALVEVRSYRVHPVYKKRLLRSKKYHVHDEQDSKVGDEVKFIPSKPYSKTKKWKVVEILKRRKKKK